MRKFSVLYAGMETYDLISESGNIAQMLNKMVEIPNLDVNDVFNHYVIEPEIEALQNKLKDACMEFADTLHEMDNACSRELMKRAGENLEYFE